MKIINLLFNFFIIFYMIFLFYWQGKNYKLNFFSMPFVYKIGIPFTIKYFTYKNIRNEFSGKIIDLLNVIFINKLNLKIEYIDIMDKHNNYDFILNLNGKMNQEIDYFHSNNITSEISSVIIYNKKSKKNFGIAIKNDLFYYINNENNYIFVNSLEEAYNFLNNNNDYFLILSEVYYNNNNNINDTNKFIINKIKKKINGINLLFNERLYWLVHFFNKILSKEIKNYEY